MDNTKIAIVFFGLTRCLSKTVDSIKKNIFNVLTEHNLDYDIFMHTYTIDGKYTNSYNGLSIKYENENVKNLLNPKYLLIDKQEEIIKKLNFDKYCNKLNDNNAWGDKKQQKIFLQNMILALYSKNKITNVLKKHKTNYKYAIILRPDLKFFNKLDINIFKELNDQNICVPKQDWYTGCNDRLSIATIKNALYYGTLYNSLLNYSKKYNIISEKFLLDMLQHLSIIKKNIIYKTIKPIKTESKINVFTKMSKKSKTNVGSIC